MTSTPLKSHLVTYTADLGHAYAHDVIVLVRKAPTERDAILAALLDAVGYENGNDHAFEPSDSYIDLENLRAVHELFDCDVISYRHCKATALEEREAFVLKTLAEKGLIGALDYVPFPSSVNTTKEL